MKAIADSIIYLQKQIDETKNNERLHGLRLRLMGQKEGLLYALRMMGLDFEFTNIECSEGRIYQTLGARGPLGQD